MERFRFPDDVPIENKVVTRAIETAQRNVESNNFEIRKRLLEYDDVMNTQREVIYNERESILEGQEIHSQVEEMIPDVIDAALERLIDDSMHPSDWDIEGFFRYIKGIYPASFGPNDIDMEAVSYEGLREALVEDAMEVYAGRETEFTESGKDIKDIERLVMLRVVDNRWRDHLYDMDHLRDSVGLRSFAGHDPLIEYKNEAYGTFQELTFSIQEEFLRYMFHIQVVKADEKPAMRVVEEGPGSGGKKKKKKPAQAHSDKVGRNAPCPCGSGKKYKHCCGKAV
jgi:preprotein translocase subunit SecA